MKIERYILMAMAVLMAGCHSMRQVAGPETETAPVATPQVRAHEVVNFAATVEGIGVDGQLRMVEDSALWLSVSKLIEVGRGLATKDSVWISAPLTGVSFAGTYDDLSRRAGRPLSFDELQRMATADDAEEQLGRLAAELGFTATVRITARRRVESLAMPFRKQR